MYAVSGCKTLCFWNKNFTYFPSFKYTINIPSYLLFQFMLYSCILTVYFFPFPPSFYRINNVNRGKKGRKRKLKLQLRKPYKMYSSLVVMLLISFIQILTFAAFPEYWENTILSIFLVTTVAETNDANVENRFQMDVNQSVGFSLSLCIIN